MTLDLFVLFPGINPNSPSEKSNNAILKMMLLLSHNHICLSIHNGPSTIQVGSLWLENTEELIYMSGFISFQGSPNILIPHLSKHKILWPTLV